MSINSDGRRYIPLAVSIGVAFLFALAVSFKHLPDKPERTSEPVNQYQRGAFIVIPTTYEGAQGLLPQPPWTPAVIGGSNILEDAPFKKIIPTGARFLVTSNSGRLGLIVWDNFGPTMAEKTELTSDPKAPVKVIIWSPE